MASWQLWLIQALISQRGDEQDLIPPCHDLWLGGGSKERDTPPSPGWLNTFANARILYACKHPLFDFFRIDGTLSSSLMSHLQQTVCTVAVNVPSSLLSMA